MCQLKGKLQIYRNFFYYFGNLETYYQINLSKQKASYFFAVHKTVFNQYIKIHKNYLS